MHFHLPTPLHGWRAFAGEVGVIVLGVLIALGFGQLAESMHDNIVAEQARDAIRAEVRENLWWLNVRERDESCIRRRLAELGDLLAQARQGAQIPIVQHIGILPHAKITTLRWEANAQAGRASLFSGEEQRSLGNMYFTTEQFREAQQQEEIVWSKMRFIQDTNRLSPEDVHDFSVLLAQARYQNWVVLLSLKRAHQWAHGLQLTPANPGIKAEDNVDRWYASRAQICEPLAASQTHGKNVGGPDAAGEAADVP
jgi:hypothetical protein